jgi:hypothetical protein
MENISREAERSCREMDLVVLEKFGEFDTRRMNNWGNQGIFRRL